MEPERNSKVGFSIFAEKILSVEPKKSIAAYSLGSMLYMIRKDDSGQLDSEFVRFWVASMIIAGKKVSTVRRYFGKVHSLYNVWCDKGDVDPFVELIPQLAAFPDSHNGEADNNLSLIKRLLSKSEKSADRQAICIFFYLLYNPEATIADVADLTFESAPRFCPQVDDIIGSCGSSHGRKYVFRLNQGKSRAHEICTKIVRQQMELLTSVGMSFRNGFSRDSITSLWISAALKAGVAIGDIKACIKNVPKDYHALTLVEANDIDEGSRRNIICRVADSINSQAKRWFVMKLRNGVTTEDIKERIKETLPDRLDSMLFFSPSRKEVRKETHKKVVEEIPYLPGILFFKTQTDKVKSLFAKIGDLAWCFRTSNSPDSDYSVISHRQMTNFQRCVGQFTSDIEMELVDSAQPMERGRKVRVVGGIMAGYEGEILDVEGEPGKRVFYISLSNSTRAEWTAYVEDTLIEAMD